MPEPTVTLYGFWRSMAAYRVRVALHLKGVAFREIPVDLDAGGQFSAGFLALNPEGAVPALVEPGQAPITQSLAILEYLEERFPDPPLLPPDPAGRARVRAIAALIAGDTHPLLVPRVRRYLAEQAGLDAAGGRAWSITWMNRAVATLEAKLAADAATGAFCHGDGPTFADLCLASLLVIGRVAGGFRPQAAPTVTRILAACEALSAFQAADPLRQAGAPPARA